MFALEYNAARGRFQHTHDSVYQRCLASTIGSDERHNLFFFDIKGDTPKSPERIEFIKTMPFTKVENVDKNFLKEDIARKLKASI